MNELGTRLKKAREYLGLTQEDVAKLMGVSRVIITNIENGLRKVSADELAKFSKLYGWTIEELLEEKKEKRKLDEALDFIQEQTFIQYKDFTIKYKCRIEDTVCTRDVYEIVKENKK